MWFYDGLEFTDEMIGDNVGFVYMIINHSNNKKYIGKKLFTKSKSYQKNKKKRKTRVSSDWLNYYGSNKELIHDVKSLDKHQISREILRLCKSKGELSYYETKYIFDSDSLLRDDYYNSWVSCRINANVLMNIKKNKALLFNKFEVSSS